jgi:methionyl-tRNA formyltransferase
LRLIYLGTPQFAVPSLEAIVRAGHDVITVVTQPDRPKGRGQALAMSPVKICALAHGLAVFQPERVRRPEAQEHLRALMPEIMAVVGYGQIIPQAVIDIAPRGIVNVHASLLPRLRGAAPIQWSIVRGDTVTGVTTMQIDAGLDTGDMLLKAETSIGADEDAIALGERLSHMGADLLITTLDQLRQGAITPEKQDASLSTYAPILKKEDGRIDWSRPASEIHAMVRGLQPWPGAYSTFRGQGFHIWISHRADQATDSAPGSLHFTRDGLFVTCGEGTMLKLIEVQMEGRRKMNAEDFARGQRFAEHERLGE